MIAIEADLDEAAADGIDRDWLAYDHAGRIPLTDEALAEARTFVMDAWRERAREVGDPEPADLSSSCKFGTLFVKVVFGGRIEGTEEHQFNVVDGRIVDLSRDAADVRALRRPHCHDPGFVGVEAHLDSLESCLPRVRRWTEEFLGPRLAPSP